MELYGGRYLLCVPLKNRFRALFTLKSVKSDRAVDIIAKAFNDPSALLRHELAYVLGQMKNPHAIPVLASVLATLNEDCMVRHEAAEAIGAIGLEQGIPILEAYRTEEQEASRVVRETVELAIERIHYEIAQKKDGKEIDTFGAGYYSIDPAPALETKQKEGSKIKEMSTKEVGEILMNTELPLFLRYKAMFALRNRHNEEAVLELAKGFADESALFRHEIAYVFGQMQHVASVPSLIETMNRPGEEAMVRHEAAEALGSIATPECFEVLEKFKADSAQVVKESCMIGLDMAEFEASGDFQYAETVEVVKGDSIPEMKGETRQA
ncbi:ARM repeat-containing protein [Rhizoclosmatium globosum]|uniref:Deoxyhypusine hydroxylase n=1 Tax=Rhizoclosmatium globosum TaxID=329046 RepID=A0A1Y2C759_9FUNG|nr:ARM repeat-containing protein [Rhizoclosmatium globosum]|eukprot:ORY42145.1 ARM repeat-containing protein [Rhizoclosmatium globosum]